MPQVVRFLLIAVCMLTGGEIVVAGQNEAARPQAITSIRAGATATDGGVGWASTPLAGTGPQLQSSITKFYGINFSPYLDGQDPNAGSQISETQIKSRLQIAAPYMSWVRTFGSTNGLERIPAIARQFGLKVAANAWISGNVAQNSLELTNLATAVNAGLVDIAIIGSEAILRNDVTEAQLIGYINQFRQATQAKVPVATADVWGTFLAHPNLISASDVVFVNLYPFWEGTAVNNAVCSLALEYQQVVNAAGSKPVIISETGWPSAGGTIGLAIASPENARQFALQFMTWAASRSIPAFYFEAFDETWKVRYEGAPGPHWGLWDTSGAMKPGMDAYFNGQVAPVACDGTIPGPVAVKFTYVPPLGSYDALEVQATGVRASDYRLAAYINVGGWWTKPTFAQPAVIINVDGSAQIPIVTGGSDQYATDIAVFLIPAGTTPPRADGGGLPAVPNAAAALQVNRTARSISGTIRDAQSRPIVGAIISDPVLGQAVSAPDGKYCFYHIATTGTVTLTVSHARFTFSESPMTVSIPSNNLSINFVGIERQFNVAQIDINADGKADVLWQHPTSGDLWVWYMNETARAGHSAISGSTAWRVPAAADFNGDGMTDVLWQEPSTGELWVWFMNGSTRTSHAPLSGPTTWRVAGAADFNRDGKTDILWQYPVTGDVWVWFMDGATRIGHAPISGPTEWRVAGAADINGDGKMDILWQHPVTGDLWVWFMDGTSRVDHAPLSGATAWRVAGTGDYNSDGKTDILWQLPAGGDLWVWFMDGSTRIGAAPVSGSTSWKAIGSR